MDGFLGGFFWKHFMNFPLNTALGLALIIGPGELDHREDHAHLNSAVSSTKQICLEWQILDPREVKWTFLPDVIWVSECNTARHRWADLWDAPGVEDCDKFPCCNVVDENLGFNLRYQLYINEQVRLYEDSPELLYLQAKNQQLRETWTMLQEAVNERLYLHIRRCALKNLRERLGDAYYTGSMPDFVPCEYFRRLR
jgi:hypothetical protein